MLHGIDGEVAAEPELVISFEIELMHSLIGAIVFIPPQRMAALTVLPWLMVRSMTCSTVGIGVATLRMVLRVGSWQTTNTSG